MTELFGQNPGFNLLHRVGKVLYGCGNLQHWEVFSHHLGCKHSGLEGVIANFLHIKTGQIGFDVSFYDLEIENVAFGNRQEALTCPTTVLAVYGLFYRNRRKIELGETDKTIGNCMVTEQNNLCCNVVLGGEIQPDPAFTSSEVFYGHCVISTSIPLLHIHPS